MKKIVCILALFCVLQNCLNAQEDKKIDAVSEISKTEFDSIIKVIDQAFALSKQSKAGEALQITNSVLKLLDKRENDFLRAKAYNVIATSYVYLDESEKGKEYFIKAKDIFVKIKDTSKIIMSYNNIGVAQRQTNNPELALEYFKKAYKLALEKNNLKEALYPSYNIGNDFIFFQEKPQLAIPYLKKSLEYANDINLDSTKSIISNIHLLLGKAYIDNRDIKNALEYYDKAESNASIYGHLDVLSGLYELKADYYTKVKNFESANEMLKKQFHINDSIRELEEYELVKKIETEYLVKENEERLKFVEKEKEIQASVISKTKIYNTLLAVFSAILLLSVYYILKKNRELSSAKEKAEKLSQAKSDFYSEISHELRTPLYAVIELSSLLLNENVNVEHKEYLESLKFSGDHLLSLINNVLELNKVESGKVKLEMLDFDLKNLVTNIIDSLEYALRDSLNKIHLDYDNTIPRIITGDSLKLSQVIINLISNAIKFTNKGNINVTIKKVEDEKETIKIYFNVKDDGLGIPLDKQSRVFEDFYQEHAKSENSYKGTGLGLSIVKRIVNTMGSEIKMESTEGEGTSFFFTVEFLKSNKSQIPVVEYSEYLNTIKDCKILIVDDNKINQIVTKKVLEQLNLKSISVDSGEEAVTLVKQEKFDCILMDLHMPGLDGYQTTEAIREFNEEIAIVALTAASTEEIKDEMKDSKMNGFILKPFLTLDFVVAISKAITKKI